MAVRTYDIQYWFDQETANFVIVTFTYFLVENKWVKMCYSKKNSR